MEDQAADLPIELQTGAYTRAGIRDIADWKTFQATLREARYIINNNVSPTICRFICLITRCLGR